MKRKGFLLVGVIAILRLFLLLKYPLGISVDQAILWGKWGFGEVGIVLAGWFVLVSSVIAISLLVPPKARFWVALVAVTNPWWNTLSLFYVLEMAILLGLLLLALSKKPVLKVVVVLAVLVMLFLDKESFRRLNQYNILRQLSRSGLSEEVNLIQSTNFAATDKTFMLPPIVRKVIYNKPFLALQIISQKFVSLFDFEQLTSPLSAWEITKLSGLPPKGLLPLFFFWEVPLLLFGLAKFGGNWWRQYRFWLILGLLPALIWEKKYFTVSGIVLSVPLVVLVGQTLAELKFKWVFLLLYLVGFFYFSKLMFVNQNDYRAADAPLYREMTLWVKEHLNEYDQVIVTNKFGPTDLMFKFYGVPGTEKIQFREFLIKDEHLLGKIVYLGQPKEMAEGKILDKIEASDELVFGHGNGIWIGTK